MKQIISTMILGVILFSNFFVISADDSSIYKLDESYIVNDVSFDLRVDSFYLTGGIRDSRDSFIIKSQHGQFLNENIIEDFKVSKIFTDNYSSTYVLGRSAYGDIYIMRFTSGLNKRWEYKIKFSDMDLVSDFTVNDNQEVTLIGYSYHNRKSNTFLLKLNRFGNKITEKIIDIGPFERPRKILENSEGNFYITGESKIKDYDMFVYKLTSDFEILWSHYFDHGWEDGGLGLALIDEELVAAGYSGEDDWFVFDTVFFVYSPDGNVSSFTRENYSEGGSDWILDFKINGDNYYAILWDVLTENQYTLKLDSDFELLSKNQIKREETPIKLMNIEEETYLLYKKDNRIYLRAL